MFNSGTSKLNFDIFRKFKHKRNEDICFDSYLLIAVRLLFLEEFVFSLSQQGVDQFLPFDLRADEKIKHLFNIHVKGSEGINYNLENQIFK